MRLGRAHEILYGRSLLCQRRLPDVFDNAFPTTFQRFNRFCFLRSRNSVFYTFPPCRVQRVSFRSWGDTVPGGAIPVGDGTRIVRTPSLLFGPSLLVVRVSRPCFSDLWFRRRPALKLLPRRRQIYYVCKTARKLSVSFLRSAGTRYNYDSGIRRITGARVTRFYVPTGRHTATCERRRLLLALAAGPDRVITRDCYDDGHNMNQLLCIGDPSQNVMAESKGSLIAKSVSKHAGRAKEKVRNHPIPCCVIMKRNQMLSTCGVSPSVGRLLFLLSFRRLSVFHGDIDDTR